MSCNLIKDSYMYKSVSTDIYIPPYAEAVKVVTKASKY